MGIYPLCFIIPSLKGGSIMSSILPSTQNTRPISKNSLKYIRSDVPVKLTEQEMDWLLENGITTAVDLRLPYEQEQKPCVLKGRAEFTYLSCPISGGPDVPMTTAEVAGYYLAKLDDKMKTAIDSILNAKTGVIYFCNAGKDRTGVVSAILMKKLGASDEEIITDYLESKDNLTDNINEYVALHPEIDREIITPHREYMEEFLSEYKERGLQF